MKIRGRIASDNEMIRNRKTLMGEIKLNAEIPLHACPAGEMQVAGRRSSAWMEKRNPTTSIVIRASMESL